MEWNVCYRVNSWNESYVIERRVRKKNMLESEQKKKELYVME